MSTCFSPSFARGRGGRRHDRPPRSTSSSAREDLVERLLPLPAVPPHRIVAVNALADVVEARPRRRPVQLMSGCQQTRPNASSRPARRPGNIPAARSRRSPRTSPRQYLAGESRFPRKAVLVTIRFRQVACARALLTGAGGRGERPEFPNAGRFRTLGAGPGAEPPKFLSCGAFRDCWASSLSQPDTHEQCFPPS